jgi:hypothetical protein
LQVQANLMAGIQDAAAGSPIIGSIAAELHRESSSSMSVVPPRTTSAFAEYCAILRSLTAPS